MRAYLYKGLNIGILLSNDTLTKYGIDIINTKSIIRISSDGENIKVPFKYKKVSGSPIVLYITCMALKNCLKRGSTIKARKAVKFANQA